MTAIETLNDFTIGNLPDLDVAVLGALEMLGGAMLPETNVEFVKPLVIGSGNAEHTGRIIFRDKGAVFANESNFEHILDEHPEIDGVVIISASGSKHSVTIAKHIQNIGLKTVLFTTNPISPAAEIVREGNVRVFPKNREPYTYNTSTYFGMVTAKTMEDPEAVSTHLKTAFKNLPDLAKYTSFTFILPAGMTLIAPMVRTKFDELFGTHLSARFYTPEEIKHAKTIVPNDQELFISMTPAGNSWGEGGSRFALELTSEGYLEALAHTYYLVGLIQKAHPPYFKDNIVRYCEDASTYFGSTVNPIVD